MMNSSPDFIDELTQLRQECQQLKQEKASLEKQLKENNQQIEALNNKQILLQLVVDNIPSLIFWKDKKSLFQGCNRPWAKAAGFNHPDEIIGKTDYDLYPSSVNVDEYIEKDRHVLNSGETEYHLEYKPAKDVWYDTRKIPIRDPQGNIVGLLATIENITQRKKAEEALRIAEEKYRSIFENALEGIFQSTPDGKFINVNPSMARIYGYDSPEELMTEITEISTQIYVEPKCRELFESLMQENQEVKGLHYQAYRRDGSIIWVEENTRAVKDEQGNILYYEGIIQDITQRKQAQQVLANYNRTLEEKIAERTQELQQEIQERQQKEQALEEAKKEADRANQAKSIFIANMSHELRTPLNAIIGFAQLLRRDTTFTAEQQQQLEIINQSGEHLLSLINSILDLSKIEAGKITINPNYFDLHYLLKEIQFMLQLKAETKGIYLNFHLADGLPQLVKIDESKLRQILINLLGNALKFTKKGGVTLRAFKVSSNPENELDSCLICFEIEDTGVGISTHELPQLFLAFEQTSSGQKIQQGTGLGLAISHKFIELMGGEIKVNSEVNKGTCLTLILPFQLAVSEVVISPSSRRKVIGLSPNQEQYRILVVDDTLESRLFLNKLLLSVGFAVREASNGEEAIQIWQNWQPQLIWMDMRMPVMNGYEATQLIKNSPQGQNTVIIALTASAFEEEKAAILAAGCDGFVRKPVVEATIFETMAQYLGVQYLYEDEIPIASSLIASKNGEDISLAEVLSLMPPHWGEQLQEMALQLNRKQVIKLIEQIPLSHAHIAEYLNKLVQNYQFPQIIAQVNAATSHH